jgi:4-hydroxy-3-polyprenylbenzoate decarboxylase
VVQCETVDLRVPGSAEIVIEGHMSPERAGTEGPMGEFAGYVPHESSMQPVYTIEAITHRDDPIWPTTVEGEPVDEYHTVTGTGAAAEHFNNLRTAGLPVTMTWVPYKFACHVMVISVASDWREQLPGVERLELSRRIWEVIQSGRSILGARYFILDDDVDPSDLGELGWALATRVHPTKRHLVNEGHILPLMACYDMEERYPKGGGPPIAPKVTYDALMIAEAEGREHRLGCRTAGTRPSRGSRTRRQHRTVPSRPSTWTGGSWLGPGGEWCGGDGGVVRDPRWTR